MHCARTHPQEDARVLLVGHVLCFDGEQNGAQLVIVAYERCVLLEERFQIYVERGFNALLFGSGFKQIE